MDAERMKLLQKEWIVAEIVMARACRALPSPASQEREQFEGSIRLFHEHIQHNEIELAFEALCAAAELVDCQGGVWRDLERAAEVMGFHDRMPYLRERFRTAPIQGVKGDRRQRVRRHSLPSLAQERRERSAKKH
jgi:hypothetical protein